jgi:phosphoribosylformylglycinamidine synthase
MSVLHQAISSGLVRACHDCSEGGLAVCLAEMAMGGRLGVSAQLAGVPTTPDLQTDAEVLFSESSGRFVVEVAREHQPAFEALFVDMPLGRLGQVTEEQILQVAGLQGDASLSVDVPALVQAWRG